MKIAAMMRIALVTLASSMVPQTSYAEDYPARPIEVIVPFAAGSGGDLAVRILVDQLKADTGEDFLVSNAPGAGGVVGTGKIARAKPDGYTLGYTGSSTHSAAPYLFKSLAYSPFDDFIHVSPFVQVPYVLIADPALGFSSLNDLIAEAKKNPGSLKRGYATGSTQMVSAALLKGLAIDTVAIPYKGNPEMMTDLLGSRLSFVVTDSANAVPYVTSGRAKAFAVLGYQRLTVMPEIATLGEQGLAPVDLVGWTGLSVPKGTQPDIVKWLHDTIRAGLANPSVQQKINATGLQIMDDQPVDSFGDWVSQQYAIWGQAATDAGVVPQ
ncbi:MAG: tripartite tricarboxylate transporter substrate binding protein [Rhizobiaceae bacterium]|nr:tripartite tricarboxylate transporter substrate binding protein [Rhizobiaceae bacterium]